MKSYQKNILLFLSGIAALIIAFLTMRGTIQNYISFAGVANEIAFTLLSTLYGISAIFAGIPSRHFKSKKS